PDGGPPRRLLGRGKGHASPCPGGPRTARRGLRPAVLPGRPHARRQHSGGRARRHFPAAEGSGEPSAAGAGHPLGRGHRRPPTGPRELALFDPATRERRQTFRLGHEHVRNGEDARFSPDGRTLLVCYMAQTWLNRLPVPDRFRLWLRQTGYVSDHNTVAAAFDVATGRPL